MDKLNAKLEKAINLVNQNRPSEAIKICTKLIKKKPKLALTYYVLANAYKKKHMFNDAISNYKKCILIEPNQEVALLELGTLYLKLDAYKDALNNFEKTLQINPNQITACYNKALTYFKLTEFENAIKTLKNALTINPSHSSSLELLAVIYSQKKQSENAINVINKLLNLNPQNYALIHRKASLLRESGEFTTALKLLKSLVSTNYEGPILYKSLAGLSYDTQDIEAAKNYYDFAILKYPLSETLHYVRAKFLWELGNKHEYLTALKEAVNNYPNNIELRGALFDLLSNLENYDELYNQVRIAKQYISDNNPRLKLAEAVACSGVGELSRAEKLLESILSHDATSALPKRVFIEVLIKQSKFNKALKYCNEFLSINGYDQSALAMKVTILELLQDETVSNILNYESMVKVVSVGRPQEYDTDNNFFKAVSESLYKLHLTNAHPIDQTVRGGTQTNGFLFSNKSQVINELYDQIKQAITKALNSFPENTTHPYWGRNNNSFRMTGAWSVKLAQKGFHTNHYHPDGWISAVLYIEVPEFESGSSEGHLQLGVPSFKTIPKINPKRIIRPKVGRLCLFPSYAWHGTLPYQQEGTRLTIAFDIVPDK